MADSKITALTSISTSTDPANDPLVIVDVSDTSMAATGTTKKVTLNQLLGSGGTATLASATITGDLTVRTDKLKVDASGVGIGTTATTTGGGICCIQHASNNGLVIDATAGNPTLYLRNIVDTTPAKIMFTDNTGLLIANVSSTLATFSSTGNVGIGVTPNTWTSYKALQVQSASIFSTTGNDTAYGSNFYYDGAYRFRSASSDKACMYSQFAGQHQWHYTASAGTAGNVATFTQGMTLDASGNLIIGTTGTNWSTVAGFYYFAGSSLNITRDGNPSLLLNRLTSDGAIADFRRSGSAVGSISVTTTSTAYNTSSDYRLKESVAPLTGGLARISALKPSVYKWKADGSNGEGFLAHELAEVVPAAVSGEKDAVNDDGSIKAQGVDLSKVVPVLVAAIQELTAEVNALKNA